MFMFGNKRINIVLLILETHSRGIHRQLTRVFSLNGRARMQKRRTSETWFPSTRIRVVRVLHRNLYHNNKLSASGSIRVCGTLCPVSRTFRGYASPTPLRRHTRHGPDSIGAVFFPFFVLFRPFRRTGIGFCLLFFVLII